MERGGGHHPAIASHNEIQTSGTEAGGSSMTQGNDGLRYTIDRRIGRYFWSFTDLSNMQVSVDTTRQ
jgi:hypothetical protein